ncbi:MAG: sigma-70 family RNA polymerase sigma factor [Bryobacterales bacterium]|nr:sigma-70 family RNA polymerase sigma factor [Bryobacterales bacterium]
MGQEEPAGEVTRLLQSWREGDPEAFERLIPVVYDQLHRIALGLMRHERSDHTLQATALLNELYVRLLNQRKVSWEARGHFFTFTARLMRNILVDHARSRTAQRRGGEDQWKLPITDDLPWIGDADENLFDLSRALDKLEKLDARKARIVELRFFLSFTTVETADVLGISHATVERELKFARSWLFRELRGEDAAR